MLTGGAFGYITDYLLWWALYLSLIVHTWCFFRFFPRKTHRRAALIIGNALIFLCLLATGAIFGESYFRFVSIRTDAYGISLPARRWFALYTDMNSMGCRDKEWQVEKPAGAYRIAVVGDSFTYGWGIADPADRFTDILQSRFDARAPGTQVLNVAKAGWSTAQEIAPIADMVGRFDVDEVVLAYVPNDIEDLLPKTPDFDPKRPPEPVLFDPDRSPLLDFLWRRIYLPRLPAVREYQDRLADGYADDAIMRRHATNLVSIIQTCKQAGARFRVILLPFVRTSGERLQTPALHGMLAEFLTANGAEVLDLAPALAGIPPADLVVNASDPHPNELAHRRFADAIWDKFYAAPSP
jgi:lysophospholipase L1-like esterase